jgi:hypothetical protein
MAQTPDNTQPRGALTPGLAALLDRTVERNRKDAQYEAITGRSRAAETDPMQLALFDVNDAGDFVGWNGETL